uniref:Uncharacterized protein n=1 Tax=Panagrolaimus sp. JU765 TaxID=591449 RepID=A0AC34QG69_9BILA
MKSKSIFYSEVIESELKQRLMAISCQKLKAAQKGGSDPLRKSLQILQLLNFVQQNDHLRLEDECRALLYMPLSSTTQSTTRQRPRMIVTIEPAPPQRISVPVPVPVPEIEEAMEAIPDDEMEECGQDGGSMARKRKAHGISDAGHQNSKLRIRE